MSLDYIEFAKRTGLEEITNPSKPSKLLNFWQWAYSDLIGNTERGMLAEYLVALACGIDDKPRISWGAYDLELDNGVKIEVKSSAYIQTWKQKTFSKPIFNIQKTLAWNYKENTYGIEKKRHADIYVFALLAHKDQATLNPIDTSQWEFYVIHTEAIDSHSGDVKHVSLNALINMGAFQCGFADLLSVINGIKNIAKKNPL